MKCDIKCNTSDNLAVVQADMISHCEQQLEELTAGGTGSEEGRTTERQGQWELMSAPHGLDKQKRDAL